MEAEPIVGFSHLSQTDNQLLGLLDYFAFTDQNRTLRFGNSEEPVFTIVVEYFDLETSIQKAGMDFVGRHLTDSWQFDVNPK